MNPVADNSDNGVNQFTPTNSSGSNQASSDPLADLDKIIEAARQEEEAKKHAAEAAASSTIQQPIIKPEEASVNEEMPVIPEPPASTSDSQEEIQSSVPANGEPAGIGEIPLSQVQVPTETPAAPIEEFNGPSANASPPPQEPAANSGFSYPASEQNPQLQTTEEMPMQADQPEQIEEGGLTPSQQKVIAALEELFKEANAKQKAAI